MKRIIGFIFLLSAFATYAQSKDEKAIIEKTYLLMHTVFGTKDSLTLEGLFAKTATYGHSGGSIQTREEAIKGAAQSQSVYKDTSISKLSVIFEGNTAISRFIFKATEVAKGGKSSSLNLGIMLVWVKEKGKWKLFGRQAFKL